MSFAASFEGSITFEGALARLGVGVVATRALRAAASRPRGMLLFCGSAGAGKTTLAHHVVAAQLQTAVHWVGDLRMKEETERALILAAKRPVVAVARSGESGEWQRRWADMAGLIDEASVVVATIRRLPRTPVEELDALVVEVLGEDGTLRTGSLAEEAGILVDAGVTSAEHARFFVPGYA